MPAKKLPTALFIKISWENMGSIQAEPAIDIVGFKDLSLSLLAGCCVDLKRATFTLPDGTLVPTRWSDVPLPLLENNSRKTPLVVLARLVSAAPPVDANTMAANKLRAEAQAEDQYSQLMAEEEKVIQEANAKKEAAKKAKKKAAKAKKKEQAAKLEEAEVKAVPPPPEAPEEPLVLENCCHYQGYTHLAKSHPVLEQKAWETIKSDFGPIPEFGEYELAGSKYNQRQRQMAKFDLSSTNLQQVFDRLKTLHRYLIHGDLKGEHIRVNANNEIVFIDFDACSLHRSSRHTPYYASLELLLQSYPKFKVDDLEAVLWACYKNEVGDTTNYCGGALGESVVNRLTLMCSILQGGGGVSPALQAAFAHVWLLPRADLIDDDYKLPLTLDSFREKVQRFQSKLIVRAMSFGNNMPGPVGSTLNTNDKGNINGFLEEEEEQKLGLEWEHFFKEKPINNKPDIKLWTRSLRAGPEMLSDHTLLLFNHQFEHSALKCANNVQPRQQVPDFTSDDRKPFLDEPTGTLVLFETSIAEKDLCHVFSRLEDFLPQPYRALDVLLTFSCVILRHKEARGTIHVRRYTLDRCLRTRMLSAIVLAASGRFAIYLHSSAHVKFVDTVVVAQEIFSDDRTNSPLTLEVEWVLKQEEAIREQQAALANEKAAFQREKDAFRNDQKAEKEAFRKQEDAFRKETEAFWKKEEDFLKEQEAFRKEKEAFRKKEEAFRKKEEDFQKEKNIFSGSLNK